MLLSSSQNTSSTAAVWQEHQQEGRVAAEVSKEACDALNQGHGASMTSRASLTLPVVQISLSSRVGQSNSFSTTGQRRTHVFQRLHIPSFEMSLVQPKPIVKTLCLPAHYIIIASLVGPEATGRREIRNFKTPRKPIYIS